MLTLILALTLGQTPSLAVAIADGPMPVVAPEPIDDPKPEPIPAPRPAPPEPPPTPRIINEKAWIDTIEDGLVYGVRDGKGVTWLPNENPDAMARRAAKVAPPVKYTLVDNNGQAWKSADWNQLWNHVQTENLKAQSAYTRYTVSNGVTYAQACSSGSCSAPQRVGLFGGGFR